MNPHQQTQSGDAATAEPKISVSVLGLSAEYTLPRSWLARLRTRFGSHPADQRVQAAGAWCHINVGEKDEGRIYGAIYFANFHFSERAVRSLQLTKANLGHHPIPDISSHIASSTSAVLPPHRVSAVGFDVPLFIHHIRAIRHGLDGAPNPLSSPRTVMSLSGQLETLENGLIGVHQFAIDYITPMFYFYNHGANDSHA